MFEYLFNFIITNTKMDSTHTVGEFDWNDDNSKYFYSELESESEDDTESTTNTTESTTNTTESDFSDYHFDYVAALKKDRVDKNNIPDISYYIW